MNWVTDIKQMHAKFGVHDWLDHSTPEDRSRLMKLRIRMLTEEYGETLNAYLQGDAEEVIDGLIDLCVIAIGTLDIAGVDAQRAWRSVLEANMAKVPGVKPGRPNPLGLPDLTKPSGWSGPCHAGNHGDLERIIN